MLVHGMWKLSGFAEGLKGWIAGFDLVRRRVEVERVRWLTPPDASQKHASVGFQMNLLCLAYFFTPNSIQNQNQVLECTIYTKPLSGKWVLLSYVVAFFAGVFKRVKHKNR